MSGLRITNTNSVNDSKGRAFGLEGNDSLYVVGAFVAALGLYLLLNIAFSLPLAASLVVSLPVLFGPLAWVLLLRRNKPAGYAEDLFDDVINGEGWSLAPGTQPVPPERRRHE